MAFRLVADHAHADLAQPAQIGWVAERFNALNMLTMSTGESGLFLNLATRPPQSREASQGFPHCFYSRNFMLTLTVPT